MGRWWYGSGMQLREASTADADAIASIYAPYVRDTAITFEIDPPSAAEMAQRVANIGEGGETEMAAREAHREAAEQRAEHACDAEARQRRGRIALQPLEAVTRRPHERQRDRRHRLCGHVVEGEAGLDFHGCHFAFGGRFVAAHVNAVRGRC